MRCHNFGDVTQRKLVVTDVSRQPVGTTIKGQAVQEEIVGLLDS